LLCLWLVKNAEPTVPRTILSSEGRALPSKRDSESRFVHYKSDIASGNLALVPGTAQNANRIDGKSNSSQGTPTWARGTTTDGSDENTMLIDADQFRDLLAEIATPAPSPSSTREPIVLDSDSELTRVQFPSPIHDAVTSPIAPAMGAAMYEAVTAPAMTAPASTFDNEERTMLAGPAAIANSRAAEPVPLSYQQGDEHTAILTQDQRQEWLNHNADNTAILSGPEVAQWLSQPAQSSLPPEPRVEFVPPHGAPMPAPMGAPMHPPMGAPMAAFPMVGAMPNAPEDLAQGTVSPNGPAVDEELFALPHQVSASPDKAASKLLGNIFLGLFAVMAVLAGLAFALPAERAALQERIFPTAEAPTVNSATHAKPVIDPGKLEGAKKLNTERMMSKAASAVTAGRRPEALRIYQELATAYPSVPLYANLVHALKVSEATR
jgi:hypothetical protein